MIPEGYLVQNACANCEHFIIRGGYDEPETYFCKQNEEPVYYLRRQATLSKRYTKEEVAERNNAALKWEKENAVQPNGICSKWELKTPKPPQPGYNPDDIPF